MKDVGVWKAEILIMVTWWFIDGLTTLKKSDYSMLVVKEVVMNIDEHNWLSVA